MKFTDHKGDEPPLKLDLGTGKGAKRPAGFVGVDKDGHPGVEVVADLREPWPWADGSVDEISACHVLQFFGGRDRVHFVNELYRVLKPGGKAVITTPHWCSHRGYMDLAAQWPPVSEGWYARLGKNWREQQNHNDPDGYTCDFDAPPGLGYSLLDHPDLNFRNQEHMLLRMTFDKEVCQDLVVTLVKR